MFNRKKCLWEKRKILGTLSAICLASTLVIMMGILPVWGARASAVRSDIGFFVNLQPYIEAPAEQVMLDIVAFSNEASTIPVIFKELTLYVGDDTTPFTTLKVNQVLKSMQGSGLSTTLVKDIIFPHPLNARWQPVNQDFIYRKYGNNLWQQTVSLNLPELAPKLNYNDSLQIRAEGTFVNGGEPEVLVATSSATYMAPLAFPGNGQASILADTYNGWYRIDAHYHSNWSDGNATISAAAQAAKNAGLAALVITDHGDQFDPASSNYKNLGSWQDQRNYILNNTFALPITNGEEVTEDPEFTTSSHYLAYDLKSWVYNGIHYNYGGGELYNSNEQPLVDAVNTNNAPYSIGGPAHPGLDVYPWNGMEETKMGFMEVFDAVGGLDGESMNMWDQWNAAHLTNILNGTESFIAAVANSDGHNATDAGKYSTYFYAPTGVTSARDYFNALRQKKVVASQTPSFGYWTLNGNPMGSIIDVTNGQTLTFGFTHVPRGYNYNYVSRVLIILNDGSNNPRNINVYPLETSTSSSFTIRPGDTLYPTRNGYYRISIELRHQTYTWWTSSYSWTICQPIFFRFH